MKPVLMIHDVYEDIFSLPLSDYTLTFDDGLYSQYAYLQRFSAIPTDKIFFISTKFLCDGIQSHKFPKSPIAHQKARVGNYEDFMTPDQVREILATSGCYIGGHGHQHLMLRDIPTKVGVIQAIKTDTEEMLDIFFRDFGLAPTKFCFPYNYDIDGLYPALLRRYGFTSFYGRERISVETLLLR